MSKTDLTTLYKTQVSLTEWFELIKDPRVQDLRVEDTDKRERLATINQATGLPFDKPYQFPATDLVSKPPAFVAFLREHGHELCALRLNPLRKELPKLRMRGHTINNSLEWFAEQKVDPTFYRADFVPHSDNPIWSTIFVVNKRGIFGEIIAGGHHQLTQGFHEKDHPILFTFDFKDWTLSEKNPAALEHLQEISSYLLVTSGPIQKELETKLNASFAHNYLRGYFETVSTKEFGLWFIDYNQTLGEIYNNFFPLNIDQSHSANSRVLLQGMSGSAGKATGIVHIVNPDAIPETTFNSEEVLVCTFTTPDYVPLMAQAKAIVTDQGGVLSHAAIIARELKKPCIVATKEATVLLHDGDTIEVDADAGTVILLKR